MLCGVGLFSGRWLTALVSFSEGSWPWRCERVSKSGCGCAERGSQGAGASVAWRKEPTEDARTCL